MRDEHGSQFSPSYSGTLPPREIIISTGTTMTTPPAGGGGGGAQEPQQEEMLETPTLAEGQRTPSHAHLKQCKSRDTGEGIEVEVESVATSPHDPKVKRFTFDGLPTPSSANYTNQEVEERDVVEELMESANRQTATSNDINNDRILNNLTSEARDAVLDAWGGLSPMSEDDRLGEHTGEAFSPKRKIGTGDSDALLDVIEESVVEIITKPSDEKDSVLIVQEEDIDPVVATQAPNAEPIDNIVDNDESQEKEDVSVSGVAEPDGAVVAVTDVTEAEPAPERNPVVVSPDSAKAPEPAGVIVTVPEPTPSQELSSPVALSPSESVNSHTAKPSVSAVIEPSESDGVEVQRVASVVDVVNASTADERDAVLDAWGLSQEQLDMQAQDTATENKRICLRELVLCYDPSTELIPPALGNLKAIAEATTDDQLAAKTAEPLTKDEGTSTTKDEEKKTEDPKDEKIKSTQTKKPKVVTIAGVTEEHLSKSPMSESGSVVSNGSVKAKVAMWERKIREVPFDEPPVASTKPQQVDAEEPVFITSQATPEHSNLAKACAASFVEGTHCAPADTFTVSFDETNNIGPIASLLDKEDDDSQVAVREVVPAPSDEDKDHLSSGKKHVAPPGVSTNGGQEARDGGTEVDESLEAEIAVESDGTIGDVVCGASTISGDVITYLFSPRSSQLMEGSICCSPTKASEAIINTEDPSKVDADFSKNDIGATDK